MLGIYSAMELFWHRVLLSCPCWTWAHFVGSGKPWTCDPWPMPPSLWWIFFSLTSKYDRQSLHFQKGTAARVRIDILWTIAWITHAEGLVLWCATLQPRHKPLPHLQNRRHSIHCLMSLRLFTFTTVSKEALCFDSNACYSTPESKPSSPVSCARILTRCFHTQLSCALRENVGRFAFLHNFNWRAEPIPHQ